MRTQAGSLRGGLVLVLASVLMGASALMSGCNSPVTPTTPTSSDAAQYFWPDSIQSLTFDDGLNTHDITLSRSGSFVAASDVTGTTHNGTIGFTLAGGSVLASDLTVGTFFSLPSP